MAKKTGERLEDLKTKFSKKAVDDRARAEMPFTHRWHNRFHVEAPFGLISDPNGLANCNGEYHIFCQWNPLGINHKNKSWMHTKTRDFINYSVPELSLWPTDIHDKDGCHSGCGFVEDGKLRVFYTCNSRDEDYIRTVAQRFGTLQEDGSVLKEEFQLFGNPEGYTAHFRDPNFFYRNGIRYFAMAAQRMSDPAKSSRKIDPAKSSYPLNGAILVYKETDDGWKLLGEIKTDYYDFGYMWECPNLLKFEDQDVLIICPQGVPHEELRYQNHCLAGYLVGHFSVDNLEMMHGNFQELDRGFDFYSPQVFANEARHIMVGWMGMPDLVNEIASAEYGWLYTLTMPRELTLKHGHLYTQPVKEIEALRQDYQAIDTSATEKISINLGDGSESDITIKFGAARKVCFDIVYDGEKVAMSYDRDNQIMFIDRTGMKLGGQGTRKFKLFANQELQFRMFVDHSAVELFLQNGEEAAGFLVYPEKEGTPKLEIYADTPIENICGKVWQLGQFNYE